jgi:hypothetical protein
MERGAKWLAIGAVSSLAVVAAAAACMHSRPQGQPHMRAAHSAAEDQPQPTTVDIQGAAEWKRAPQMRAYYEETVATFANGTDIDVDAYEARSFEIFRAFARAHGADEAGMVDHLKLIPRQVVDIVKEDPAVLETYDKFWAALSGPD